MGKIDAALNKAGVKFSSEPTMSNGFYATTYRFPSIKEARKAEKATGIWAKGGRGNWHMTLC